MATEHASAQEGLGDYLRWSIIGHGSIFVLIILKGLIFPSIDSDYSPTLKVDLVGLPDILKKDLHKIKVGTPKESATKEALTEKKKSKGMTFNDRKGKVREKRRQKIKSALDRIKALEKIKEEGDVPLIKGNQISPGKTLTGEAKERAQRSYYDDVLEKLRSRWALPVWLARQRLSAKVLIYIDRRGEIRGMIFRKSSGNSQFDDAVRQCIKDSVPFPTPPEDYRSSLLSNGILLGFPL